VKSNSCAQDDKKLEANPNQLTFYDIPGMNCGFFGMKNCPLELIVGQPKYELCVILSKSAKSPTTLTPDLFNYPK